MKSFELYRDEDGEFRWRFRARNGKIVADSAEGYTTKAKCRAGIKLVRNSSDALLEDLTE